MKKVAAVVLFVIPLFMSPAMANPSPDGPRLTRQILYLGAEFPDVKVLPAHAPIPAASTGVGPGSQLLMTRPDGSFLCTANFVWAGASEAGEKTYLGAAGHCFVEEGKRSTHGPDANYDPALTKVFVCVSSCQFGGQVGGATGTFAPLGPVAYARQTRTTMGEGDDPVGNDFGIVEVPSNLMGSIRPQIPVWGGPTTNEDVQQGGGVCLYGNGVATGESFPTKARAGAGLGLASDRRSWKAFLPSTPGDSGSAIVTCGTDASGVHGKGAAGILTHIELWPESARVVGTTVPQAVQMAQHEALISLKPLMEDGSTSNATPLEAPPPPSPAGSPDGWLMMGQEYSWSAGPFTRIPSQAGLVFGETCKAPGDHCNYEFLHVIVPEGGGLLRVTIASSNPTADFDLFVYGPDGFFLDSSAGAFTPPEEVAARIVQSGVYTIGVNAFSTVNASYSGKVKLEPPPPPPPPPPVLSGDGHIYQGGVIDPFILGGHTVVPGSSVTLSVRALHSNSDSVTLAVGSFEAVHVVKKDGVVVYGPFDAQERADGPNFRSDSPWQVPQNAVLGEYIFESYVTVSGVTYLAATLPFSVGP